MEKGEWFMRQLISYPITEDAPGWPGNPTYHIEPFESMDKGDVANTYVMTIFNHFGTHMDAPRHFNPNGLRIWEMPFDRFFYEKPLLLDIPKGSKSKVEPEDLIPYEAKIKDCDLLLIRTGYGKIRATDPEEYKYNSPSVSKRAAKYLMDHFCGSLKTIAFDFLSLGSPIDKSDDGMVAHQTMLGMHHDGYICIVEDANLENLPDVPLKAAASVPLFTVGTDSGPVTMWVEY